jgi:hypothetical protein
MPDRTARCRPVRGCPVQPIGQQVAAIVPAIGGFAYQPDAGDVGAAFRGRPTGARGVSHSTSSPKRAGRAVGQLHRPHIQRSRSAGDQPYAGVNRRDRRAAPPWRSWRRWQASTLWIEGGRRGPAAQRFLRVRARWPGICPSRRAGGGLATIDCINFARHRQTRLDQRGKAARASRAGAGATGQSTWPTPRFAVRTLAWCNGLASCPRFSPYAVIALFASTAAYAAEPRDSILRSRSIRDWPLSRA